MGEFELIHELFAPLATHPGAFGLTDDASVFKIPEGQEGVVTKDVMVAGVHFLEGTDPARVAQKLLRANLSDLAAMGADPLGYWLGVQLPKEGAQDWLAAFVTGLKRDQEEFGISLMGGDTVSTPGPGALSLTAMGTVPAGSALRRSGARPGDKVFVSGTIGEGVLGLRAARGELDALADQDCAKLVDHLECPQPRLALGQALRGIASAAIDISDGLAADAGHIADTSGAALVIDGDKVPRSATARKALAKGLTSLEELVTGGDDFELLFTVPQEGASRVAALNGAVSVTEIGEVRAGSGVRITHDGAPLSLPRGGYTHF
jgi:thiamine-monophosphate kinase